MDTINDVIHRAVNSYVGRGVNGYSYLIENPEQTAWTVVFVLNLDGKRVVRTGLIVRLLNDQVVIEQDTNDPPLVDALTKLGVPRSKIILAYANEPAPEAM